MTPQRLLKYGVIPALTELAHLGIPDSPQSRRFLVAIALQESKINHRRQLTASGAENGPAASFWQFEKGGGCAGLFRHHATEDKIVRICSIFNIEANAASLWEAMRFNDIVAAAAARLLIYTLPDKLPLNSVDGWAQYLDAWRPGKPHESTWAAHWVSAGRVVQEV